LDVFDADNNATVFYLSGTTGWGPTLGDRPTVMWNPAGGVYIVRQPQGVATNVGATVSFSVLASGTAPVSYQWWKDATSLTAATNLTFTIANVQPADAGRYTVEVTDRGGSTTSQVAILDVYETPPGGFLYTPNANGTVTITGYTGPGGTGNIPDTINGLPVMAIGDDAFYNCARLTRIAIPDSVTSIGIGAFWECTSLTSVTIPNHVTSIGRGAFNGCASLTNITIPDSVTSIGEDAFSDCFSLTSVTLPSRITSIGRLTFQNCLCLTSVTIPDSVTGIGDLAFDDCTSLANITIPDSVTSIGGWAFGSCHSLTSVTIPSHLTSIAGFAFSGCGLIHLTIPDGVTSIGWGAFSVCTSLTNATIPNSVTSIGDHAFDGCASLIGVYFWGNAPSLGGQYVFYNDNQATVHYLPGTTGWGSTFGGRPTAFWVLPYPVILTSPPSFGIQTNAFGFIISWATNLSVVAEASPTLAHPVWVPLGTNALVNGWSYFSDPHWTNYPSRFYRIRSP
jgi:hypothetical protein